jgi:hypothetical protein
MKRVEENYSTDKFYADVSSDSTALPFFLAKYCSARAWFFR